MAVISSCLKWQGRPGESQSPTLHFLMHLFDTVVKLRTFCSPLWRCRPAWVTLLLVTLLQHVTAKFAFIKKEAGTRDLNNRFYSFYKSFL